MTPNTLEQRARRIASAIRYNFQQWFEDRVSYERFDERQGKLWGIAVRAGIEGRVFELATGGIR